MFVLDLMEINAIRWDRDGLGSQSVGWNPESSPHYLSITRKVTPSP